MTNLQFASIRLDVAIMTTEQIVEEIENNQIWQDIAAIAGDEPSSNELEEMQLLKDELSIREFNDWLHS